MTVAAVANSRIFWRHPPQQVESMSPSHTVSTTASSRSPADTIAAIALASAHHPCGYAAFSTLQPTYTRPVADRTAAPTGKCEYGT